VSYACFVDGMRFVKDMRSELERESFDDEVQFVDPRRSAAFCVG